MSKRSQVLALVSAAGLVASVAQAQDSVSRAQGLPGDAPFAYAAGESLNTYVVDLAQVESSWGNVFGIAPIVKASRSSSNFLGSLFNGQSISQTTRVTNFPFDTYSLWNGQGFGVNDNDALNLPGEKINVGDDDTVQFSVAFGEFGTTDSGTSFNGIIGAVINYLPDQPGRLYVSRTSVAINGGDSSTDNSQFGMGVVDSGGFVTFRADGFRVTGPRPLQGQNIFRVGMLELDPGLLNAFSNDGATDQADWIVRRAGTTHGVPNAIPEDVAGRPLYIGANFDRNYVYESSPLNTTQTAAHRIGADDHRGAIAYTTGNFFNASVNGTAATLSKPTQDGGPTTGLSLFGLAADGAPAGTRLLVLPQNDIVDNDDGFSTTQYDEGTDEFGHYTSQTAFRGGTSQVALHVADDGTLYASSIVYATSFLNNNPSNYIAVARVTPGGEESWTLAAWNFFDRNDTVGKPIYDGDGNVIGELAELLEVTGGDPLGPSFSAPAFDSAGNIWFVGAVELFDRGPKGESDFDSALIRAVFDADTFSYRLEKVIELGTVITGVNSETDYRINFLEIADSDSASSGSFFSSNVMTEAYARNGGDLDPADPRTLGGLVLTAEIVYDVNGDGEFQKITGQNGDPNSPDQEYRVLLFLGGAFGEQGPECPVDFDGNGFADGGDFLAFLSFFFGNDPRADLDDNGTIDGADFLTFLSLFFSPECQP